MYQSRPASWQTSLVWLICVLYAIVNIRWILVYRLGSVLELDEAGYQTFAFQYFYAYQNGGFWNWLAAVQGPSIFSPLTAALASIVFMLFGKHLALTYMVPLVAGLITIVTTYLMANRVMGHRRALVCLLLVVSLPATIDYARVFHFALPATAATCLALFALVRSNHVRNLWWTIIFGVSVGLLPLFRTMTLAFIPGLALAALVHGLSHPTDQMERSRYPRPQRLLQSPVDGFLWFWRGTCFGQSASGVLRLFVAGLVAIAVSMLWFWVNAEGVFEYLTNYGYGAKATEFGPSQFWWGATVAVLSAIHITHLPHAAFIFAGGVAALIFAIRQRRMLGNSCFFQQILQSKVTPLAIFVAFASLVLLTSSNKGSAFVLPILPPAILLAVWAIFRPGQGRLYNAAATTSAIVIAAMGSIPSLDLNWKFASVRNVRLPGNIEVVVTSGRSAIENYMLNAGIGDRKLPSVISHEESAQWMNLSEVMFADIKKLAGHNQLVMFGFRNAILNSNTVVLANLMDDQQKYFISGIDPNSAGYIRMTHIEHGLHRVGQPTRAIC